MSYQPDLSPEHRKLSEKIAQLESENDFLRREIDVIMSDLIQLDALHIEELMRSKKRERSFRFLQRLHREILSSRNPGYICKIIVCALTRNIGFDRAVIFRKQEGSYRPVAHDGYTSDDISETLSDPFFADHVEQDGILLINGLNRHEYPEDFETRFRVGFFIAVAIPFSLHKMERHILFVGNETEKTARRPRLTRSDADTLLGLGRHIAVALENVSLYQTLEQKVRKRTEKLREANRQLRQEIAERSCAEDSLKNAYAQLNTLLEAIPDAICFKDAEGRHLLVNKAWESLVGLTREEIIGRTDADLLPPELAVRCQNRDAQVMKSGNFMQFSESCTDGNGERTYFDSVRIPLFDDEHHIAGLISMSRNVTRRKKMEEELNKARQLESIGILAGGIAHDFNNLLTVIMGNISMAKMTVPTLNNCMKFLDEAEKASLQARHLTRKLITFSKGGEPVKKRLSVSGLLREAAEKALEGSGIRCLYAIPDGLPPVLADRAQISQAIRSILINALEAMPGGGEIEITARKIRITSDSPLKLKAGDYIKVSIKDQGSGIPEKQLDKIFDPYFSTKEMGSRKGTGLGLSITHSVIRKHGGLIMADSVGGSGTTFHIHLPTASAGSDRASGRKRSAALNKGKILVMDDKTMVRDITGQILSSLGYRAEFVRNSAEAVEKYAAARKADTPFDAVILAATVREGPDGKRTAHRLSEIDAGVRTVISVDDCTDPLMSCFQAHGFRGCIAKPYQIRELERVLAGVLTPKEEQPDE